MSDRFYFAFPDDRIGYDCDRCGYRCCKGAGFSVTDREKEALLALRPELRCFTYSESGNFAAGPGRELINLSYGCFMLQKDGRCEIETKLGRKLKPWVCRLYPTNHVSRIGDYFVFNFHVIGQDIICPFTVDGSGSRIRHAVLRADLRDWEHHPARAGADVCGGLESSARTLIGKERAILRELEGLRKETPGEEALSLAAETERSAVTDLLRHLAGEFGLRVPELRASDGSVLAAFLPSLRMKYFTEFHRQGYASAREHVSKFVLMNYLLAGATAEILKRPLTGDLLLTIGAKMRRIFQLACLLDQEVCLEIPKDETVAFPVDSPASLALVHLLRKKGGLRLGEVVAESAELSRPSRDQLVSHLGALQPLAPYLVPAESASLIA